MNFVNTISIADIISIVAIVISLVTIVFLFVQRKDSSKAKVYLHDNHSVIAANKNRFINSRLDVKLRISGQDCIQNVSIDLYLYSFETNKVIDFYTNDRIGWRLEHEKCLMSEIVTHDEPLDLTNVLTDCLGIMTEMWTKEILQSFKENPPKGIMRPSYLLYLCCSYKDLNNYCYKIYYRIETRLSNFAIDGNKSNLTECFLKIKPIKKKEMAKVLKSNKDKEDFWYTNSFRE